jgi:hypothetical protein
MIGCMTGEGMPSTPARRAPEDRVPQMLQYGLSEAWVIAAGGAFDLSTSSALAEAFEVTARKHSLTGADQVLTVRATVAEAAAD